MNKQLSNFRKLNAVRDALLPKLLSGELRVPSSALHKMDVPG